MRRILYPLLLLLCCWRPVTAQQTVPVITSEPLKEWPVPAAPAATVPAAPQPVFLTAPQYPFLQEDINLIINGEEGLTRFYRALEMLENGVRDKVVIAHIGDSHIQADVFPGVVRTTLQKQFGNAGRGLVFPHRVAHTNGPDDIRSSSNAAWEARRNSLSAGSLPTGISGMAMRTSDPNFVLQLSVKDREDGLDYRFDKVTVFCAQGANSHDLIFSRPVQEQAVQREVIAVAQPAGSITYHTVRSGETLGGIAAKYGCTVAQLKQWNGLGSNLIRIGQKLVVRKTSASAAPATRAVTYQPNRFDDLARLSNAWETNPEPVYLPELQSGIVLRTTQEPGKQTLLYGLVLENSGSKGVLYHTIGVNGAQYKNYLNAEYFLEQIGHLKPDLIVISLGTNEMLVKMFDSDAFYREVDAFIHALRERMPQADILLTTPPDACRARKYQNPHLLTGKNMLLGYAIHHRLACWDFYEVMGGQGSIQRWYNNRLAQPDKVHLTHSGYVLQGELFSQALLRGYEDWKRTGR